MPFMFSPARPHEVMELDYISIGRAVNAGLIEPLGSGFYILNEGFTPADITTFLTGGNVPVYVTHVTYDDLSEDLYRGSMSATLAWVASLTRTIGSFTTGRVIAEDTERGIRDRINGVTS